MSFAKCAFQFLQKCLQAAERLGAVRYINVRDVSNVQPGYAKWLVMCHGILLINCFKEKLTENGWTLMLQPEHRSFALMKRCVWKFFKTSDLVLDVFTGLLL